MTEEKKQQRARATDEQIKFVTEMVTWAKPHLPKQYSNLVMDRLKEKGYEYPGTEFNFKKQVQKVFRLELYVWEIALAIYDVGLLASKEKNK